MGRGGKSGSSRKRKKKRLLFNKLKIKQCCFCKKTLTFRTSTLEHVIPKSQGGTNEIKNLKISCAPCNNARGTKNFLEYFQYKRRLLYGVYSDVNRS
mgnify:FL=1